MDSPNRSLLFALVGPAVLGTIAVCVFVGVEIVGATPPLAQASPMNLAEAAAMGSMADVWRFLDAGQDPAATYDVRSHIISSSIRRVTAWEGVMWSRRVEVVMFMDGRHRLADADRPRIACLAKELGIDDIQEYLGGANESCSGSMVEQLAQRSR